MQRVLWFGLLLVPLLGCVKPRPIPHGAAAIVLRHTAGGVLALQGDQDVARADAERQMQAHCQGPHRILDQGNVAVGQEAETKSTIIAYRIIYKCASDASPP